MSWSAHNRTVHRTNLQDKIFDILVIGGGINGAGVARDAALRGLSVLMVDRGDLASGTSSASSRLIHGGLRYLEHYKIGLVHESVVERWRLLQLAPHLVRPLPFLFPVYKGEKPGLGLISMGTFAYGMLSAFRTPGPRRTHRGPDSLRELEPLLKTENLVGAAQYYDCSTNDARLTLENAMDAAQNGADIWTYCEVTKTRRVDDGVEVDLRDMRDQWTGTARARCVVVAAGPWTDTLLKTTDTDEKGWLRPTKGVHLVFPRNRLPVNHAVVMKSEPDDGRISFAIPWGNYTYVGTTDTDFPNPDEPITVTAADARYLLDNVNRYFPDRKVSVDDVHAVWAGLRPLVAPEGEDIDPSDVSREEQIETLHGRYVSVAGGKLTTYRVMAKKVVDRAMHILKADGREVSGKCPTCKRPLPGSEGLESLQREAESLVQQFSSLPSDWLRYLAGKYGVRGRDIARLAQADIALGDPLPGCTWVRRAELEYSIEEELVTCVDDFLIRRTYIHFRTEDQGSQAAKAVAEALVRHKVCTSEEAQSQVEAYRNGLERWKADIRQ